VIEMEDNVKMLKKQMNDLLDRLANEENEYQKMVKEYTKINVDATIAFRRFEKIATASLIVGNEDSTWANMLVAGARARPDLRDDWLDADTKKREYEMRVEAQKQRVISLRLLIEVNMSLLEMETK